MDVHMTCVQVTWLSAIPIIKIGQSDTVINFTSKYLFFWSNSVSCQ